PSVSAENHPRQWLAVEGIEGVCRLVRHADLRVQVNKIASLSRWSTASRVDALDARYAGEAACTGIRRRIEQQPRYRRAVGRIGMRPDPAADLATVGQFPGRAGVVLADLVAITVEQIRLRGLERPREARRVGHRSAHVDLRAGRSNLQGEFFVQRNLQALRNCWRRGSPGGAGVADNGERRGDA